MTLSYKNIWDWAERYPLQENHKRIKLGLEMTSLSDIIIDDLVQNTIPIYTDLHRHPVKNKKDCDIDRQYKKGIRVSMKKELQVVVAKYEKKVSEL